MKLMLYEKTSDLDNKQIHKMLTEVVNQVRNMIIVHRLLYNWTSLCYQWSQTLLCM